GAARAAEPHRRLERRPRGGGTQIEYLFLTPAPLINMGGVITTYGASARLGSLMPARALMRLGYDARTYTTAGDAAPAEEALRAAKRVVLGELFDDPRGWQFPVAA